MPCSWTCTPIHVKVTVGPNASCSAAVTSIAGSRRLHTCTDTRHSLPGFGWPAVGCIAHWAALSTHTFRSSKQPIPKCAARWSGLRQVSTVLLAGGAAKTPSAGPTCDACAVLQIARKARFAEQSLIVVSDWGRRWQSRPRTPTTQLQYSATPTQDGLVPQPLLPSLTYKLLG